MDFSNLTFRCSSLGYIMSEPKGKSNLQKYNECAERLKKKSETYANTVNKTTKTAEKCFEDCVKLKQKLEELEPIKDKIHLSDTCKTHLCDLYTRIKYGRNEEIITKYLEKGLLLEEDAITLYSLYSGKFHKKNTERRYNDYIEGEMDFLDDDDYVNDTKVNWSIFQFNRTLAKPLNPMYRWQLKGYMWLWKKPKARVIYTLLNTPEHMIEREIKKLTYELFGHPDNLQYATDEEKKYLEDAIAELRKNMIYDDIPINERVRPFEVERDKVDEERIKNRVIECRKYLQMLDDGIVREEEIAEEVSEEDE